MVVKNEMMPKVKLTSEEYDQYMSLISKLKIAESKVEIETFYHKAKIIIEKAKQRAWKHAL
jgi:hypothetical protein